MFCPLEEIELNSEVCPARCMYRRSSGSCAYNELAFNEELTSETIAEILEIDRNKVKEEAEKGTRRIQAALAADAYIAFICRGNPVNKGKDEHPIFSLFNFSSSNIRKVLNETNYEKWKQISKVAVSFEDIKRLFRTVKQGV